MRAIVCHDYDESSIEEVPRPEPSSEEVLISVNRVQLSVTECRLYRGENLAHAESIAERLQSPPARLFGHEFCGEILEAGEAVTEYEPGDRVYSPGKIYCGECAYCESGLTNLCPNKVQVGYDRPGATAEYVALPTEPLATLPDGVSDAEGAAMQPFASALATVDESGIRTGDVIAVVGAGVMGYQIGQLAFENGAREVFAIDVVPSKLELAAERGMTPVDGREDSPVERIHAATEAAGADTVFEAVGGRQEHGSAGDDPLALGYRIARAGGSIVQVGHILDEVSLRPQDYRSKGVDWRNPAQGIGATGPNTRLGEFAPELIADGRVSIEELVTHELDGLEAFDEAVDLTLDDETGLGPAQMVL